MLRFARNLLMVLFLAALAGAAYLLFVSDDPLYTLQEWLYKQSFREYDPLIIELAEKHAVDAMLVKAVVWRESSFQKEKVGRDGERGLMQVTEGAAADWARVRKIENFVATDLFDPKTNLDAGTWYLAQALDRWSGKDDPVPFALAEYNAGKRRVDRWLQDTNMGALATSEDLRSSISFPSTREYINDIIARYRFYQRRGWM
jgi:soluble lytic murein transglycosylase